MTTPVLQVRGLRIDFAQPRPAVNDVHLEVAPGEVVALVGESGSGKSMTARAVLGLLPPRARAEGSITVRGREVLNASEDVLNEVRGGAVGMVFQEPQTALNPVRTIGWQLTEALRAHGDLSRREARLRAKDLLVQVELPDPEERLGYYPHQLSGGQKQRVVLALALANDPALLLADEPTTALDVTVQAEILDLLRQLNQRIGTSILLITHNMGVVAEMADRVVVLRSGDVVEEAGVQEIFASPQHPYTRQLLEAVPRLPRAGSPGPEPAERRDDVTVVLDGASVVYPARRGHPAFTALDDVSVSIAPGEVFGLVGESGSGKTTLGRAAAGLVPLAAGRVLLEGDDLAQVSGPRLREIRKHLAFVPQDPAASLDPLHTIGESIAEPLHVHRVGTRAERDARVRQLLDAVRLPAEYAKRRPRELSGGQRQRVALARALALRPRLLIADEPTSALDVSIQADVLALFAQLQEEFGFACIFISHDLAVVHQVADTVAVLQSGRVVESGPVHQVFTAPSDDYTRRLLEAVPVPDPTTRGSVTARHGEVLTSQSAAS
jgi:peptide/nickel transport system ATP-binding protein